MISRRHLMTGAAALAGAAAQTATSSKKPVVISSANGLGACKKAMDMLHSGADTLDAVIAGVNLLELDPNDHSVGFGGLPNEEGVVELDASVMHGPSRKCGAVGAITGIKTPSNVAKLVMTETDHIMLAGHNATRFAVAMGFKEENVLVEDARLAWMVWKRSMRDKNGHTNWANETDAMGKPTAELREMFPHADEKTLAWAMHVALHPPTGTINCLSLNARGEMSGVTTTSGMAWKIPGRLGDSPIIGAGLYVDQDYGGAGSTGRGEENIRIAGAHTIVDNMRHGMTPKEACLDALKRVSRNFNDDHNRLEAIDLQFYALRKDGLYSGASLWNKSSATSRNLTMFAVNDGGESRHEPVVYLYER
ncbi:MAG TPA: N(4)-(beta-N-acetylglucosaminyl)-L-asparaginase [Bryobacteraceae bacterium]|nr:N(4)-(beta-N-acetylglucosaminyl)-L-asparaginase [Bryobacteraceae bacterium]